MDVRSLKRAQDGGKPSRHGCEHRIYVVQKSRFTRAPDSPKVRATVNPEQES
jgi:hypothetical protein